jgi:hypothetical protein
MVINITKLGQDNQIGFLDVSLQRQYVRPTNHSLISRRPQR